MDEKTGQIVLEIPGIDIFDLPHVVGEIEQFMKSLQEKGYKSKFDAYHINSQMDHYVYPEEDDDDEGGGEEPEKPDDPDDHDEEIVSVGKAVKQLESVN